MLVTCTHARAKGRVSACRKNVFDRDLDEIGGYFYRAGVRAATRTGRLLTLSLNKSLQELKMAGNLRKRQKKWREARKSPH
jgi:plasmid stabilization system protein ParE